MSLFKVGDKVVVRKAPRSFYESEDVYEGFPDYMEGKETTVRLIDAHSVFGGVSYQVYGCNLTILEYELFRISPVLETEAEWE